MAAERKPGQKSLLLQAYGKLLFGEDGGVFVTQGIYVQEDKKLKNLCKRTVWIPRSFSVKHLEQTFSNFQISFIPPPGMTSIGLCGGCATRTARALDDMLMIVVAFEKKFFVVYALVSIVNDGVDVVCGISPHIVNITTDRDKIDAALLKIKEEAEEYKKSEAERKERSAIKKSLKARGKPFDRPLKRRALGRRARRTSSSDSFDLSGTIGSDDGCSESTVVSGTPVVEPIGTFHYTDVPNAPYRILPETPFVTSPPPIRRRLDYPQDSLSDDIAHPLPLTFPNVYSDPRIGSPIPEDDGFSFGRDVIDFFAV